MNRDEFIHALNTEPRSEDPEFRAARRDSIAFARLAREAEAFEDRLEEALRVDVDPALADRVLERITPDRHGRLPRWPVALAVAASITVAVGLFLGRSDPAPGAAGIDAAAVVLLEHLDHPEPAALGADPVPLADAVAALAQVGADPAAVTGAVTYVYPCPIGGEPGLHIVITDDQSERMTLLYAPGRAVGEPLRSAAADGSPARVFDVPGGAVALVAHGSQDLAEAAGRLFGAGSVRLAASLGP